MLKRSALLRGVGGSDARGVARFSDDATTLNVSMINLYPSLFDEYALVYAEGGRSARFTISDLSGGAFFLGGFSGTGAAAIVGINGNKVEAVAYGAFSDEAPDEDETLSLMRTPGGDRAESDPDRVYDDEKVAEENYFLFGGGDDGDERVRGDGESETAQKVEEEENSGGSRGDETRGRDEAAQRDGVTLSAKEKLENLLASHPRETALEYVVANSRWSRVDYGGEKYYVVGGLYEGGALFMIGYGVPGRYGEKPESVKGECEFVPKSLFDPKGEGYFVMYQNA